MLEWQPCTQFLHLIRRFYKSVIFKSWDTAVYTNISHCCGKPTTAHKSIIYSVAATKNLIASVECGSVYKNVDSDFTSPKCLHFMCRSRVEGNNYCSFDSIYALKQGHFWPWWPRILSKDADLHA